MERPQSSFYYAVERLAAVLPERATAICKKPKRPLISARCFATAARGAAADKKASLIAEATARIQQDPRPDSIALGTTVDVMVDAGVSLQDPAAAVKDLLAAARLIGRHYPYLSLPTWSEKLAGAGLESTASELAKFADGDEPIDGLAPAAIIACDNKRASGLELARAAEARVLKEKIYRENIERMALAAAALHRCGETKSAGVLFDRARDLAQKEPDLRTLTKVLQALVRAGDQARIDALLPTLLAKSSDDLAFCARELAWDGYFDISRKIIAALPSHQQEAMESGDVWRALEKLPNDASKARAVVDAYLKKPPASFTYP